MIEIKKATRNEVDTLVQFQLSMAHETENLTLNEDTLKIGVESVFENENLGSYYIAVADNKVVASLLTTYEWSDWRNGRVLWIQSVYVTPEFRRKGVYNKMYDYLKKIVIESNDFVGIRLYVDNTNLPAQKTYENLGMNGEHYKCYEWMP